MHKLGIDIGGTTIKGALFDERGDIVCEYTHPTCGKEGRAAILNALFTVIEELKTEDTVLIGISSAGNIDPNTGTCIYATDNLLGWTGTEIRKIVEEKYQMLCQVDNDAVCALKGELLEYPENKNVTMLTFGTGVGGASLINGKILRGKNFDAARWGHVCLDPHGRVCNCGRVGCAESYLSATALVNRCREEDYQVNSCAELFERYAKGDVKAKKILGEFGDYLNLLLGMIRTAIAPDMIILGGGVARSEEIIRSKITNTSDIVFAKYGNRAGVYGAITDKYDQ